MDKKVSPTQKVLNVWAIVLILWSIYRTKLSLPVWFDEFVAKPLVFILPVFLYIKQVEKKDFTSQIWLTSKNLFKNVYIAFFIGLLFALSALAANYVKFGHFSFSQTLFSQSADKLLLIVLMALATGISEEILSRGFILKRLYEESNNVFTSSFLSSILFLILHIPILFTTLHLSGSMLLLFMGTDFILSLVNSFVFLDRKSLVAPILIHALYNLSIILYS